MIWAYAIFFNKSIKKIIIKSKSFIFFAKVNAQIYRKIWASLSYLKGDTQNFFDIENNAIYYTKTEVTDDYIHTIAVTKIADFDAVYNLDDTSTIQRSNGIPNWIDPYTLELKPVSISHHGRFTRRVNGKAYSPNFRKNP